jgi:hypothetical protein
MTALAALVQSAKIRKFYHRSSLKICCNVSGTKWKSVKTITGPTESTVLHLWTIIYNSISCDTVPLRTVQEEIISTWCSTGYYLVETLSFRAKDILVSYNEGKSTCGQPETELKRDFYQDPPTMKKRRRLDRSTARSIYKAKNGKLLVWLTTSQKAKLIFKQYIQTLFDKDIF